MLKQLGQHIRLPNLVMLALVQWISYTLFSQIFSTIYLILIMFATICIAMGGYILNDIFDIEIDQINQKRNNTNPKFLYTIYWIVSLIGLCSGLIVSFQIDYTFFLWFFIPFIALSLYAQWLSRYKLIGNILISLLIAEAIVIVPFFFSTNNIVESILLEKSISYALFAFLLNWVREIVKDVEDQEGDKIQNRKTFPLLFGVFYSKLFILILLFFNVVALYFSPLFENLWTKNSLCFLLIIWAFYCLKSSTIKEFKSLSFFLKIIMLMGVLMPWIDSFT